VSQVTYLSVDVIPNTKFLLLHVHPVCSQMAVLRLRLYILYTRCHLENWKTVCSQTQQLVFDYIQFSKFHTHNGDDTLSRCHSNLDNSIQ